jgi:hypothetical protein
VLEAQLVIAAARCMSSLLFSTAMSFGTERKSQEYADGVHNTELAMKPVYLVDKMSHAGTDEHSME